MECMDASVAQKSVTASLPSAAAALQRRGIGYEKKCGITGRRDADTGQGALSESEQSYTIQLYARMQIL